MKKYYLLIILFIVTNTINSQWSQDPNENLQVAVHGGNINVVPDGNGGAILTFNNFDYEVVTTYMQAIDKYGYLKWNEPQVLFADNPKNLVSDLFRNENNSIVVGYVSGYTYIDSNLSQHSHFNPYMQKIDSNGNKQWGEEGIKLNADTTGRYIPAIDFCYDRDGGAFAFWNFVDDNSISQYPDSLYIQHISNEGEKLWGECGIFVDDSIFSALNSWVIDDDSGGIFLQYYKRTNEYYIRKYDPPGNLNWTLSVPINFSRAIKDDYGGIIISGVKDAIGPEKLIINRISSEGNKLWGEEGIIIDDSVDNNLGYPAEIYLNSDNTITVFWDNRWWPNNDLFLQRYTLGGEQLRGENLRVTDVISGKGRAGLVRSENNSNIVIWDDSRNPHGLYAQRVDEFGEKVWADSDRVLTYTNVVPTEDGIITDGNYGAIVIGQADFPWGPVIAQQISKNGNLGEVITTVKDDNYFKPGSFYLEQNYPNPFNPTTTIRFSLPESGNIKLEILNLLGEKVQTLVNEFYNVGIYNVEFNAEKLPSGIYFYSITAGDFHQTKKMILLR